MSKESKFSVGELVASQDFIRLLSESFSKLKSEEVKNLSATATKEAYKAVLETIVAAVVAGKKVRIKELGTFSTKFRPERTYHTPQDTSKRIVSPETVVVSFTPSSSFKNVVKENKALLKAHKEHQKALDSKKKK